MTDTTQAPIDGDEPVHTFFGLSYSNYYVMPRTLAQSMSLEWQHRFTAVMNELNEAYAHIERAAGYEVTPGQWISAEDCGPDGLKAAGARAYWVDSEGETIPEDDDTDLPEDAEVRYAYRGDEIEGYQEVFVPGVDPVPHYNRGRTFIAPKVSA